MTTNTTDTTTSNRRGAAVAVKRHDCADHGCLAAMLGIELGDATGGTDRD
jgi:hypothetical protein